MQNTQPLQSITRTLLTTTKIKTETIKAGDQSPDQTTFSDFSTDSE